MNTLGHGAAIIKLSGSAMETQDLGADLPFMRDFARSVAKCVLRRPLALTIGGGEVSRSFISTARALGAPDPIASLLGGDLGLVYARLACAALASENVDTGEG